MKIIHTSDWHLGQNFFGYDRSGDHEIMISQLIELIQAEEPDALVIAGDIFDVAAPNTTIQKYFAEAIVRLHDACPSMTIVCISGNHDWLPSVYLFVLPRIRYARGLIIWS